jgi:hypothetical protein
MRNRIVATLITSALLMSPIASAHAFTNGWNFIKPSNCGGYQINGVDTLFVYPIGGGVLTTTDPIAITALAPACFSGDGFFVYLNGTIWNGVSVYPGFK